MDELKTKYQEIFDLLDSLNIPYSGVEHEHADTMEACLAIEDELGAKICKNLFLCNRQQTDFYLLLMPGGKPFKTKYLSAQLGCSRLSFADAEHMAEYLNTTPGSVSALELIYDTGKKIRLVIDRDLFDDEFVGAHPGKNTATLKLRLDDLMKYTSESGHEATLITLPVDEQG